MTDYQEFVETVAKNALRLGESPRVAAESVIISTENVGDKKAINHSAEPFVDDPASQTRIWPKDVIGGRDHELLSGQPDDLRGLAVALLKSDLYKEMMEIENETMEQVAAREAERAEMEAERNLEERRERHFDRHGHFGPSRPDPGPD